MGPDKSYNSFHSIPHYLISLLSITLSHACLMKKFIAQMLRLRGVTVKVKGSSMGGGKVSAKKEENFVMVVI